MSGNTLFFDTETTGLYPSDMKKTLPSKKTWKKWRTECKLIQLGYEIRDSENNVIVKECHIIQPVGFTIPDRVTAIHGITTDGAISDGKNVRDVLNEFFNNIHTHNVNTVVAHNMFFDEGVILAELYACGLDNLIKNWSCLKKNCTMRIGSGSGKWLTLSELYIKLFGDIPSGSKLHDASTDVTLCADIWWKLNNK